MTRQLEGWLLRLAGLGARARTAVVGVEQVRRAVRRDEIRVALVASDVSQHSIDKVVPLLRARGITVIEGLSGAALGGAVGRESTAVIGIVDPHLARGMRELVGAGRGRDQKEDV